MKLPQQFILVPLVAAALALSACGSSSDPLEVDDSALDGSDADAGADADADADAGSDTDSDTGTDADADSGTGTDTDADSDTGTGTDTGTDADAGSDTGTDGDGATGEGDADGGDTGTVDDTGTSSAIVNTVDVGFTSAVVDIIDTASPFTSQGGFNPGVSDTIVRAFEDNYYVIRRFMSDSIAAYNIADPTTPLYEFSTNSDSEEVSSNPHDLIFLNSEKAYLLRYGSPVMWVVNPSATTIEEFMLSEIDLSAFDTVGPPEATRGVIVGDNLYIIMQRLDGFAPTEPGYVAVVDTTTDTLIDPGTGASLPGIELPAFNPGDVSVDESTGTIFISAFGDFGAFDGSRPSALTGGVVALDTTDFSAEQLVDDNDGTGRIINVEITSASRGYIVTSASFASTSLDQFNPVTGQIEALGIAGLTDVDIRDLAVGPEGNLWVAVADPVAPRVVIINPADNSLVSDGIATTQNPTSLAFTE